MLAITANCGAGVAVEQARKLCEAQAEGVHSQTVALHLMLDLVTPPPFVARAA
jgi:hypothetical protein